MTWRELEVKSNARRAWAEGFILAYQQLNGHRSCNNIQDPCVQATVTFYPASTEGSDISNSAALEAEAED